MGADADAMSTGYQPTTDPIAPTAANTRTAAEPLLHAEKLAALGRLLAQVTHELNNPLTTARLLTEALEHEPLPFSAMELVQALNRELEHATTIMRDLLLFVHRGPTHAIELAATDLIRGALAENERRLAATDVEMVIDLDEPLPTLKADPQALRRALANLVQNAVHALAGLEPPRRLTIRARAAGIEHAPMLLLEFEDNGPGIAPETMPHLFEPFFTTKPIGEGTGLGLTIVQEIISKHGGTIDAHNTREGGALFRIGLPALPPAEVAEGRPDSSHNDPEPATAAADHAANRTTTAAAATPGGMPDPAAPRPHVLIIDDEPELQRALRRILEHLGCDVTMALDGEAGVRHARDQAFDLVLCDVRIPGLHGAELLQQLRLQAPLAAESIVFMTGDTITRGITDFIASTGRPSLTKPFGRDQLQKLLATIRTGRT